MLLDIVHCTELPPQQKLIRPPMLVGPRIVKRHAKARRGETSWRHATLGWFLGFSKPQFLHLKNGDKNAAYFRGLLGRGNGTTSVHSRCSINSPIFSCFEHPSNFIANPSQKRQLPWVPKKTGTWKRIRFVLSRPSSSRKPWVLSLNGREPVRRELARVLAYHWPEF